ncbi:MAG: ion transporter [Clostridia bacterium]|nr:ion transporter [Clostridia bacterium]
MEKYKQIKKRVFEIISKAEDGDLASAIFDWAIMGLIALSILSIILESFQTIHANWHSTLQIFETITVMVFTIEYLLRIWTADLLYPDAKHPRLKYIFSFMAIIDLLAILPFYLPFFSADLRFLRMMRLFRLFRLLRVLKLGRYFEALQIIVQVIKASGPQLIMSVVICFFVMLFSAIIMYTVEYPVQPEQFPNVISSLWWAICTLTTVGYGDVYPITAFGRFLAAIISLVGIGIIAIPTGIIAAGFNHVIDNKQEIKEDKLLPELDNLEEEDLLVLQARIAKKLSDYGYSMTISNEQRKEL